MYLFSAQLNNPYQLNPFVGDIRKETKTDSQEQVAKAFDYYFKVGPAFWRFYYFFSSIVSQNVLKWSTVINSNAWKLVLIIFDKNWKMLTQILQATPSPPKTPKITTDLKINCLLLFYVKKQRKLPSTILPIFRKFLYEVTFFQRNETSRLVSKSLQYTTLDQRWNFSWITWKTYKIIFKMNPNQLFQNRWFRFGQYIHLSKFHFSNLQIRPTGGI